ncbi:MAG TPA: hypothetical protein VK483_14280 [Chitinophagaceae bacterium]|nr:hypothetical protein [Chitinophagaceae bacterium]
MRKVIVIIRVLLIPPANTRAAFSLIAFFFLFSSAQSQSKIDSILNKLDPQKFAASIGKKAEKLEDKLVAKSMKVLNKMQGQEEKIYRKLLSTKDSVAAKMKLSELKDKYASVKNNLKNPAIVSKGRTYLPKLDSLTTSLKFLDQNGVGGKVKDALAKTTSLQDKFQKTEEIKKFIKQRRELLKQQLEKLGMVKQLKQINKQVYYYAAQIKEYREVLKDPKKIEKKALELLSKTKLFQDFMQKNSMLASLFRMPGGQNDPNYTASLAGLQTRTQINYLIQMQIKYGGPNAQAAFTQSLQQAQAQLKDLQNKILKSGGNSSDDDIPNFKPNNQKTKSFLKRLEFGTNIQTQKSSYYFPATSDLALSIGYKLNDRSIIGVGASYKLGLGHGWDNLKLTQEGAGLRSFIDWHLKKSFWVSGGYELNYKTAFNSIVQLQQFNEWQHSGLVGISKVADVKSKFFKKTKLQLLWDFLSYQQIPRTQPIIFRTCYNF